MSNNKRHAKCMICGFLPCLCKRWYASQQLGSCNYQNSSLDCVGPVHLTAQWDTGSRPCCKGAGKKYSAMGGLLNFCSTNNGRERHNSVLVDEIIIPKHNRLGNMNRGRRIPGYGSGCPGGLGAVKPSCEGYQHPQSIKDSCVGIL